MFKTLVILYALSFWETECTPNPCQSFPHSLLSMVVSSGNCWPDWACWSLSGDAQQLMTPAYCQPAWLCATAVPLPVCCWCLSPCCHPATEGRPSTQICDVIWLDTSLCRLGSRGWRTVTLPPVLLAMPMALSHTNCNFQWTSEFLPWGPKLGGWGNDISCWWSACTVQFAIWYFTKSEAKW